MACCCGPALPCNRCAPASVLVNLTVGNIDDSPADPNRSSTTLSAFQASSCVAKAQALSGAYSLTYSPFLSTPTIVKYLYDDGIVFLELRLSCSTSGYAFIFVNAARCGPTIGSGSFYDFRCFHNTTTDNPSFFAQGFANAGLLARCQGVVISASGSGRKAYVIGFPPTPSQPDFCPVANIGLSNTYYLNHQFSFSV